MQRNCGGVNADSHGTNALTCPGTSVREPNRTRRRGVKNAASPQRFLRRRWCLFRGRIRTFVMRSSINGGSQEKILLPRPEFFWLPSPVNEREF
jgi:hypothetical protein